MRRVEGRRRSKAAIGIASLLVLGVAVTTCADRGASSDRGLEISVDSGRRHGACVWLSATVGPTASGKPIVHELPEGVQCGKADAVLVGDFDFDGRPDVGLLTFLAVPRYDFWRSDADGRLVPFRALNRALLAAPEFDEHDRRIRAADVFGPASHRVRTFRWDGPRLVLEDCYVDTQVEGRPDEHTTCTATERRP
jgi:hypothetical protein